MSTGYVTTATAVTCFIQIMINYPEIQEKVYKEIMEIVGTDRRPNLQDRINHHYLNVNIFIFFILRIFLDHY